MIKLYFIIVNVCLVLVLQYKLLRGTWGISFTESIMSLIIDRFSSFCSEAGTYLERGQWGYLPRVTFSVCIYFYSHFYEIVCLPSWLSCFMLIQEVNPGGPGSILLASPATSLLGGTYKQSLFKRVIIKCRSMYTIEITCSFNQKSCDKYSCHPKLDDPFGKKNYPKIVEPLSFQCIFITNLPSLLFLIYHFQCNILLKL